MKLTSVQARSISISNAADDVTTLICRALWPGVQQDGSFRTLRTMASIVSGLLYAVDLHDNRITLLNTSPEVAVFTGASGEVSEAAMLNRMAQSQQAMFKEHRDGCAALPDGKTTQVTLCLGSDQEDPRWFTFRHAVCQRDEFGRPASLMCTVREVTEQYQAAETLRNLTASMLRSQDSERRRIARDLHDQTAQNLLAATLSIHAAQRRGDADSDAGITEPLTNALVLLKQCEDEIRTLSYLLHPPLLDEVGLGAALGWYAEGFSERSGVVTVVRDQRPEVANTDLPRAVPEGEIILFRVVQEALTNVYRHARASFVCINMQTETEVGGCTHLVVTVTDNGLGIVDGAKPRGVGLIGMRERLRLVGGTLAVQSTPGHGTSIRASCPVGSA
ncbi:sensor histidine kinase [Roseomonas sp. ACRSG]|nr:sensor histidine kinase [Roseomonas sp. ACRSG]